MAARDARVSTTGEPIPFTADLAKPRGIAVARSGQVYVVDRAGTITSFSSEGQFQRRWALPEHSAGTPTGLAIDANDRLVVADTHYSRILIYDASGAEVARFGERGRGDGQFLLPTDVAVDREGYLYVAEYGGNDRVSKFTPEFRYVSSFGRIEDGLAALTGPSGLVFDTADTLWVADTDNHRICAFNRSGKLLKTIGGLANATVQLRYPQDIVVVPPDAGGQPSCLIVSEQLNQRVQAFALDGRSCGMGGSPGRGTGQLNHPVGLGLIADDRLAICDSGNNRLSLVSIGDVLHGSRQTN